MSDFRIPLSSKVKDRILKQEWDEHVRKIRETPVNDPVKRFDEMGPIGKMLKDVFLRENRARVKAFENPDMMKFLQKFIEIGKKRALELGCRYEDLKLSDDSGITENGLIELKWVPNIHLAGRN